MNILITGGTGFIGGFLVHKLLEKNYQITVLSRQPQDVVRKKLTCQVRPIQCLSQLTNNMYFDVVINLAGEPIMEARWNENRKKILLESRVDLTRQLIEKLKKLPSIPKVFISGSAVGYYGSYTHDKHYDENMECGNDFAASLCSKWENETKKIKKQGSRVCCLRLGVVLDNHHGMLRELLPSFYTFLGGYMESGYQMVSWIHIEDVVNSILFLLDHETAEGAFNITAPNPVSNKVFIKSLGKAIRRPAWINYPGFMIKAFFGESSMLLLRGQAAIPKKLQSLGYQWKYPKIKNALENLFYKDVKL